MRDHNEPWRCKRKESPCILLGRRSSFLSFCYPSFGLLCDIYPRVLFSFFCTSRPEVIRLLKHALSFLCERISFSSCPPSLCVVNSTLRWKTHRGWEGDLSTRSHSHSPHLVSPDSLDATRRPLACTHSFSLTPLSAVLRALLSLDSCTCLKY